MEKKQVAIENPVTISGSKITPVIQISLHCWQNKGRISFFGFKKPLYVLISQPGSPLKAFAVNGEAVSLESISLEYSELRDILEKMQSQ